MHTIEPFYNWQDFYMSSEDEKSPFFQKEYSEFYYTEKIYNHYIHPQWDYFGSPTLFMKIIFADYSEGFAVIELIGEWNDCINNDIMYLKRDIIEHMMFQGINKFILIGENVLNFHASDDCYYEEWFEELEEEDGWVALMNIRDHVLNEFTDYQLDQYFLLGGTLNDVGWRTYHPRHLCYSIADLVQRRIGI